MVWGAFAFNGKTNLAFPKGRLNALAYQNVLEDNLLLFAEMIAGPFFEFRQDSAPIHTAKTTWQWFLDNGVQVMDWPALSPDLNPMENVWAMLTRAVYAGGKQYNSTDELQASIISSWEQLQQNKLKTLITTLPNQIYKVCVKQGMFIGY